MRIPNFDEAFFAVDNMWDFFDNVEHGETSRVLLVLRAKERDLKKVVGSWRNFVSGISFR